MTNWEAVVAYFSVRSQYQPLRTEESDDKCYSV